MPSQSGFWCSALHAPWCRHLEGLKGITPQLCADNLKCTSYRVDTLLALARYTVSYVKVVGQDASPSKCVVLSTSGAARRRMTAWRNENEECFWAVKLDVGDLCGHLDNTHRALAGTLSSTVRIATSQVISFGAPWGSNECLDWCALRICLVVFMVVRDAISVSSLSAFRAAVARAVWSEELPMTNTPALLSLLDAPWGSEPAFFIIWNRFRQLRRYLSERPDEEDRIFRLLDYASSRSPGHGPILLLVDSAQEIGLHWDSEQAGWIRPGLLPCV